MTSIVVPNPSTLNNSPEAIQKALVAVAGAAAADITTLFGKQGVFIFRPNGVAGGNVYTTEASLSNAVAGFQNPTIVFDIGSPSAYFLTTVGTLDLGINATWTDQGRGYSIGFADGTTLAHPPGAISGWLGVGISQTPSLCTVTTQFSTFSIGGRCALIQFGSPNGVFFDVQSGATLQLFFREFALTSALGTPTKGLLNVEAGGAATLYATDGVVLAANSITPLTGSGAPTIAVVGDAVQVASQLYPLTKVQGVLLDASGSAIGQMVPASSPGLVFQQGVWWWSNGGSAWVPVSPQAGRTTLVSGVSPTISVAYLDANSRILLGRAAINASTALGELVAKESDRIVGATPSFKITALQAATPGSAQTGDVSDVDWTIVQTVS